MAISESVPTTHSPFHNLCLVGFPNPAFLSKPKHPPTAATLFQFRSTRKEGGERKVGTAHLVKKYQVGIMEFVYLNKCVHLRKSITMERRIYDNMNCITLQLRLEEAS